AACALAPSASSHLASHYSSRNEGIFEMASTQNYYTPLHLKMLGSLGIEGRGYNTRTSRFLLTNAPISLEKAGSLRSFVLHGRSSHQQFTD
ncbi:MAG: hypothetical protein KDD55_11010, partial [Bdellovibrionales bacterium]|nr:hypothetical protein [Bdellovibrionales bacterium]